MKRLSILLLAVIAALMALLSAPGFGQEKIIAGLKPGYSTLSVKAEEGLERSVVGHSPATEMVRLIGLTDKLGWVNIPQSEWAEADTALAWRRVNRFASAYRELGWEVEIGGIETQTPHRGVRVKIAPREFVIATAPAATAEVATVMLRDTCCNQIADLDSQLKKLRNYVDFLASQNNLGQKNNSVNGNPDSAKFYVGGQVSLYSGELGGGIAGLLTKKSGFAMAGMIDRFNGSTIATATIGHRLPWKWAPLIPMLGFRVNQNLEWRPALLLGFLNSHTQHFSSGCFLGIEGYTETIPPSYDMGLQRDGDNLQYGYCFNPGGKKNEFRVIGGIQFFLN